MWDEREIERFEGLSIERRYIDGENMEMRSR